MFYHQTTNQYIVEGTPFIINGTQYSANWLNLSTPEEKQNLGLQEVIATNSPKNDKYYWVSTELSEATLTYINTPKDLDMVKKMVVDQLNSTAYSILLPSDWMVNKSVETETPMNVEWKSWRQSIRDKCAELILQVESSISVDEIADIVIEWPTDPNNSN